MTQPPSSTAGSPADIVLRAGAVHTLVPGLPTQSALAVRGDRIVDIAPSREGVDDWIGPTTQVIDAPEGVVLPAFDDTHTHLIYAALGVFAVPVHEAADIAGFLSLIRDRATKTPPGEWITTTTNWQELTWPRAACPPHSNSIKPRTSTPCWFNEAGTMESSTAADSRSLASAPAPPARQGGSSGAPTTGH